MTIFSYGVAMEPVTEEKPRLQIWPATTSGYLRLSPQGLWFGQGTYTAPIVDLGEIYVFSGILWDSLEGFGTSIDTTIGGMKTLEVRYHDYYEPILNEAGLAWVDQELPYRLDSMWGTNGDIPWIEVENNNLVSGVMIRYVQWRATIRGD